MNNAHEQWIKKINTLLSQSKEIPMWGNIPSFDFEELSQKFSQATGQKDIIISTLACDWVDASTFFSSIKSTSHKIFTLSPLKGQALWIFPKQEQETLATALLSSSPSKGFSDTRFLEGFYQYILLEAIHCFHSIPSFSDLRLQLQDEAIMEESFFIVDIAIALASSTLYGKFALSASLHAALKHHYANKTITLTSRPHSHHIDLSLPLQIGSTTLSLQDWKKVKQGDFIILDRCSYDPTTQKGSVNISLDNTPILRARMKKNSLKIQDYAYYYEEDKPMTNENFHSEEESHPEERSAEDIHDEESIHDIDEEMTEEEHLWSEKDATKASTEELISSHEIPLTLIVEVDRISMNVDKLLQLSPGNVLELGVKPEQGVYITVGGKRVAHAELIKVGETLGVKILKLAQ
jgi:type III secretion system YscQ/HrcQ family protein